MALDTNQPVASTNAAIPTDRPAAPQANNLIRMVGNKELATIDKKMQEDQKQQTQPEIIGLVAHLHTLWEAAKNAKWVIDERLAKAIRAKKGIYNPDDLSAIREFGGSEIYMMLTNVKTRSIEAQIKDILIPAGEKPWGIDPTPVPDLPSEVAERVANQLKGELVQIFQQLGPGVPITPEMIDIRMAELADTARAEIKKIANNECTLAEQHVEDLFVEGNFYDELADFIKDFSIYNTAFLRGPFTETVKKLVWKEDESGKSRATREFVKTMKFKRVSPFDMYPAPAAKSINDGYMLERMRIRPAELSKYRETEGFSKKAIDATLLDHTTGFLTNWLWTDQERANIENRPQEITDPTSVIEVLLFNGEIPGKFLAEWGIKYEGNIADHVMVSCMFIHNRVIMLKINRNPLGWKPYYSASFDPSSDSIWGLAPTELMEDCQRMCNAAARALSNNMGIASGPQVEIFDDRVSPDTDVQRLWPWKIWKTESEPGGTGKPAINFYQPQMLSSQLMEVFTFFYGQAGEQLGVPAFEQGVGSQAQGAGETAHGLAMLMNASSKIMKDAISYIDKNVIKKVVFQTWLYAIESGKMEYEGDINIVARASEYLIIAEQLQARRQEFLAFTNNPLDFAIMGIEGRAKVLRETVKSLKMDGDEIVPPEWQMNAARECSLVPAFPREAAAEVRRPESRYPRSRYQVSPRTNQ